MTMRRREKARAKFVEYIRLIKIDGLPNIFRSNNIYMCVMWLVIFVVSWCIFLGLATNTFLAYFSYRITSSTRILSEHQALFPTVTICNVNQLTSDEAMQLMTDANVTWNEDREAWRAILALESHSLDASGRYLSEDEKRALSYSMEDMLFSCEYQGVACEASDFTWIYHPRHLNCYQFNRAHGHDAHSLRRATNTGIGNELNIELYAGLPNEQSRQVDKRGFLVFVHNNTENPFDWHTQPLLVTPGFGTHVRLKRVFYKQFNEWPYMYSECIVGEEDELLGPIGDLVWLDYVKHAQPDYLYTRTQCIDMCAHVAIQTACGCSDYKFANFVVNDTTIGVNDTVSVVNYCLSEEELACSSDFFHNTFLSDGYIAANCMARCPLECSSRMIDVYVSHFHHPPSALYVSRLRNERRPSMRQTHNHEYDYMIDLRSNVVKLSIAYDSLAYVQIDEEPKITWEDLLGVLGGHLHLFLGMSVLSFIELIELILQLLIVWCGHSDDRVQIDLTTNQVKITNEDKKKQQRPNAGDPNVRMADATMFDMQLDRILKENINNLNLGCA